MGYIAGVDREQGMLLPESLEDYIAADHPVRFLNAFVDGLDLARCGFERARPAGTGRPPFAPGDLLKLYLWGYLNQTRSSRRLERESVRNLEVIWLMRRLQPDFKTIADFRKDNAKSFKAVFRQFHLLCRDLNLFGGELVAIDGTKLKAVNSPARNYDAGKLRALLGRIDARLEEFLQALDTADSQERAGEAGSKPGGAQELGQKIEKLRERQRRYQEVLEQMEKSGAREVSLTDADARRMHKVGVGYNGQIATDERHKLIAAQEVVNEATDHGQLAPMAQAAREALEVEKLKATADGGYYDNVTIAACEALGVEVHVPRPRKGSAASHGRFDKTQFGYDAATDTYTCPAGATLKRETQYLKRGEPHIVYSNAGACRQCPRKAECTTADYRRIDRWEGEAALDRMHARVEASPGVIARRKALVEHPFGTIKFWMNQHAFLMRGLEKVRAEFSLSTLAYNIRRVLNILGVQKLLETLRQRRAAKKASSTPVSPANNMLPACLSLGRRRTSFAPANSPLTLPA
jgi:transposase